MAHLEAAQTVVALGSTGVVKQWITDNIIPVVLLIVGCIILFGSKKKDHKGALQVVGIVLIGLLVIGMASGTTATDVGASLASAFNSIITG